MKRSTIAAIASFSAVLFGACQAAPDCEGICGTALVLTTARTDAIVPALTVTANGRVIGDQLFLKLADIGPELQTVGDGGFVPRLASSWTYENPVTLVFELHPRARWHDGESVTARDVAFTFDLYRDTLVNSASRSDLDGIASVTARDDGTAAFVFHRQYAEQFYDATYHMRILPEHVLGSIPRGELREHEYVQQPLGSGPYRFGSWTPGERIELVADPDHFLGNAGIGRLIWLVTPDLTSAMSQVVTGDADVLEYLGPPANVSRAAEAENARVYDYPAGFYAYIAFNFRDPDDPSRTHPVFSDPEMRKAVAMAVDRHTVATATFGDKGLVPPGPTSPMLWIWNDSIPQTPFDVTASRAILESKGWRDSDGDGLLDRNGETLAFDLILPGSSGLRRQAGVIIQEQLRQAGIDLQLVELEFLAWLERSEAGRFDATFGIWGQSPSPAGIAQTWSSEMTSNHGRYSNPHFDDLVEAARFAPDLNTAQGLWDEALTTINADVPAIWLMAPMQSAAVNARFENVTFRPDQWGTDLWKWQLRRGEMIARDGIQAAPN